MQTSDYDLGRPALDRALTDQEYDRLETILRCLPRKDAMNLEELDGFFAALLCCPVTIPPSIYLDEVWAGGGAPFALTSDFEEFVNLAMRHWNSIGRTLASPDMVFLPRLSVEKDEEFPRGNRWAQGFLRGIDISREAWGEIFEDQDKFAMLMPIMALAHENDPDPQLRSWKTPPDRELREKVLIGLSVAVHRVYRYFQPHRMREARGHRSGGITARKIGRNDPCYCGSGKKYKRCCGNATIH